MEHNSEIAARIAHGQIAYRLAFRIRETESAISAAKTKIKVREARIAALLGK